MLLPGSDRRGWDSDPRVASSHRASGQSIPLQPVRRVVTPVDHTHPRW